MVVDFAPLSFKTVANVYHDEGVFNSILHDEVNLDTIFNHFMSHDFLVQVSIDGVFYGFFSIDEIEANGKKAAEVHAYLLPGAYRKKSMFLMKEFTRFVHTQYDHIVTAVFDVPETRHVGRAIQLIGYKEIDYTPYVISRDGKKFGRTYFIHTKE